MSVAAPGNRGPVVLDTGIFAAELVRSRAGLAEKYRPLLEGRPFVISSTTVAEVRFGAELARWGISRRTQLEQRIARSRIVWPGPELVSVYVELRVRSMRSGHPLGQKTHEADRWVAATALWLGVPLVAHDRVFTNLEGLDLLTKLD